MNRHEFGRYLANLRTQAGLSQDEMERKTGLKKSYINSLEQGAVRQPGSDKISAIVAGYRLKEEDVLAVYYSNPDENAAQEHASLDKILGKINRNRTFPLRELALRSFSEDMGLETKKLIIKLYEMATGKKLL
ncbi:MAG: helix-turn-helix domain-containing protein [Nitrospirota bacterium]